MTTLQLYRVTKKFKADVVLDEVSFEAKAGEVEMGGGSGNMGPRLVVSDGILCYCSVALQS